MAQFACSTNATFTPTASTTVLANGGLALATVGNMAKVKMFNWGGDGTSLVGYITRWARVTTAPTGAATNGTISTTSSGATPAPVCTYPLSYATTQPVSAADVNLFKQNWNVQGGGGAIVLPIGGEWFISGGTTSQVYSQIACGNVTGADANLTSYGMQWEE